MSGADTFAYKVRQFLYAQPGKRGIDIPEARHDAIVQAASGVTHAIWGQPPTPHQIQHLHDHTDGSADQITQHFHGLPHPKAKGLTVGQFHEWTAAKAAWDKHVGGQGSGPQPG